MFAKWDEAKGQNRHDDRQIDYRLQLPALHKHPACSLHRKSFDANAGIGTIHMLRRTLLSLSAAAFLADPAFAGGHSKDIVGTAVGAGTIETLVATVTAAGLVDTLKGEGSFTVFSPTDDTFAKQAHFCRSPIQSQVDFHLRIF